MRPFCHAGCVPEPAGRSPSAQRGLAAAFFGWAAGSVAVAVGLLLACAPPAAAGDATPAPPGPPHTQCQVTDPRLPEISGLAVAGDHLLVMNDGGDHIAVYVLDPACHVVDVRTAAVDPYDPEDMALAADGTIWLADIGDNNQTRSTVALLALRPDGAARVYRLSYPDGAHDAESLLLAPDGTPYLVTKEVLGASGVYRPTAPLDPGKTVPLAKVTTVTFGLTGTEGGPVGRAGELMATGGAVSGDGRFLALRTYTDAYVWPLIGSDVVGALGRPATRIALPPSRQGEAIAFATDNRSLVVSGEQLPVDVTVVPTSLAAPATATATGQPAAGLGGLDTGRSPIKSAVIAAAAAAVLVWLAGKFRRRRG